MPNSLLEVNRKRHPPSAFLVGMPFSGIEHLRLMLDSHPEFAVCSPTYFVPNILNPPGGRLSPDLLAEILREAPTWRDHKVPIDTMVNLTATYASLASADVLRLFYLSYADRFGKPRWGDSTARYAFCIRAISEILPEAHFIHVIRDGRDAATLHRRTRGWTRYRTIANHAREWKKRIQTIWWSSIFVPHYQEVRYEDLVCEPERQMRQLCLFLRVNYDPLVTTFYLRSPSRLDDLQAYTDDLGHMSREQRMRELNVADLCRPLDRKTIGIWRFDLSPEEVSAYQLVAGDLLKGFGYCQ